MKWMTGTTCELLDTRPCWMNGTTLQQPPDTFSGDGLLTWACCWCVFGTLNSAAETWPRLFSLAGATGEQQSTSRPMDSARRRIGAWGGALWGCHQGGVRRGELTAHSICVHLLHFVVATTFTQPTQPSNIHSGVFTCLTYLMTSKVYYVYLDILFSVDCFHTYSSTDSNWKFKGTCLRVIIYHNFIF